MCTSTMKPHLAATSVIRPPRYSDHTFCRKWPLALYEVAALTKTLINEIDGKHIGTFNQ